MKITFDTSVITKPFVSAGKFIATKSSALRAKLYDARLNADARSMLRAQERMDEVTKRMALFNKAATMDSPPKRRAAPVNRGTSRNKPTVQARKR